MIWPVAYGITYKRLENEGLQWPCPNEDHPGTEVMHVESFPIGEKAALRRISYCPTGETVDKEFPFLLMTGRTLHQFNAGTMTMRTRNRKLRPTDFLEIAPVDAQKLQLQKGARVLIQSRYGSASLPIRITRRVKQGELSQPFTTQQYFSIASPALIVIGT